MDAATTKDPPRNYPADWARRGAATAATASVATVRRVHPLRPAALSILIPIAIRSFPAISTTTFLSAKPVSHFDPPVHFLLASSMGIIQFSAFEFLHF
jgi:hypothetical protein